MEQRQQLHSETNAKGSSECRPPTEALHARVYAAGLQQMTTKTHVGLRHTAQNKNTKRTLKTTTTTTKMPNKKRGGLRRKRGGGAVGSGPSSLLPTRNPNTIGREGGNIASVVFTRAPSAPFGIRPSRPRDHNKTQQVVGPRTRSLLKVGDQQQQQQQQQMQQQQQQQQQQQTNEVQFQQDNENENNQQDSEFYNNNNNNYNNQNQNNEYRREEDFNERDREREREMNGEMNGENNQMMYDDQQEISEWEMMNEEEQLRQFHLERQEQEDKQRLHPLLLDPPPDSLFEKLSQDPKWDLQQLQDNGFLYLCARPSKVATSHPVSFDFMIMSHRKIKETDAPVYFVLSKDGVTMYTYDIPNYKMQQRTNNNTTNKPQPLHTMSAPEVEYMTLEHFEQAYEYHKHIMKIPFFRLYRKWKSLRTWRSAVRGRKMRSIRTSLQKRLFLLDPVLRESMLQIRLYVAKVCNYKLFRVDRNSEVPVVPLKLEEFQERQIQQRDEVRGSLDKFQDQVRKVVAETCDASLDNFLVESGFGHNEDTDSEESDDYYEDEETSQQHQGDEPTTSGLPTGQRITFTERATMRTQCRRLTRFIRLIDFTIVDTFLEIALHSTTHLLRFVEAKEDEEKVQEIDDRIAVASPKSKSKLSKLNKDGENKSNGANKNAKRASIDQKTEQLEDADEFIPLFQVRMCFDVKPRPRLRMEPSRDDFRARVDAIIFDGLKVIMRPVRLLTHRALAIYVRPSEGGLDSGKSARTSSVNVGEGLDVEAMILQNEDFRIALDDIGINIDEAFHGAQTEIQKFQPLKRQYLDNLVALKAMDEDQQSVISRYIEYDDGDFFKLLKQYTAQRTSFQAIINHSDIGIMRIDLLSFREMLVPSPTRLLSSFETLIPAIASKLLNALLDEVNVMNDIISVPPREVGAFVKIVHTFKKADAGMYEFDGRVSEANALVFLMEQQNIELAPELNTTHFLLMQTGNALKTAMTRTEEAMDANKRKFAKKLKTAVPLLRDEIYEAKGSLDHSMISEVNSPPRKVNEYLSSVEDHLTELATQAYEYQKYQEALELEVTAFDELIEVQADLNVKQKLWSALSGWGMVTQNWCESPLIQLDVLEMEKEIASYFRTASICKRKLIGNPVADLLKLIVGDFKTTLPIVSCLRAPGLRARHWDQIHKVAGFEIEHKNLTMRELMDRGITEKVEQIEIIATEAINEQVLQDMLAKVAADWKDMDFELKPYKEIKDMWTIGAVDDVFQLLDDSLVTIGAIMGSRYVGAIRDIVEKWHGKLMLLQATLDQWLECQKTWMYLEPIFAAPDIQRQLPNESKVFKNVSSSWKDIMKQTNADPNCVKQGAAKGRREAFAKNNAMLDGVQRGLEEYLQTKRGVFPRFYFLSNDELLDILARSQDPRAVQPYLRKCFDNLVQLEFSGASGSVLDIVAMFSGEGERVTLGRNLKARGNVEDWLKLVELRMRVMLHAIIKAGVVDYAVRKRKEWVLVQKAQVVTVVGKIMWCKGSEEAIQNGKLKQWYEKNLSNLQDLAQLVRTGLQRLERKAIVALVIHDVHARDIIEELVEERLDSLAGFSWKKQLRFYWEHAQNSASPVDDEWQVLVRQSASTIAYRYEYEGASGCLVITPLTDRCWMTITGALHLRLGANPAGPAGTGKTESSKDLAKALAVQCIVFNCSDQIGYKQMGKLFMGLSAAGAWTCLDEFNRIDIEVLSVVAQQMRLLRRARVANLEEVNFEGVTIPVCEHHVIVTMNPGYAGRTELPDNLKVLFRPVAMMVPDYALIAEIMLLAEGFDTAKLLAKKMVRMYKLSSEQLSQQCHYDYGMRAVKSVLVMAGSLKRENPTLSEDVVLIKACRDSNVPKFLASDLPLFHAIINDLFPGVHVPYSSYDLLQSTMVEQMIEAGLQPVPKFLAKIIQIFETQQVRFGIALVGPTGAGKTVGYKMLAAAMNDLHSKGLESDLVKDVVMKILNPKAVTMDELYGCYNIFTQEWTDGLASSIMRDFAEEDEATQRWTVFDGPVDALWIENMNTVLDDNMTLCLANGERIKLKSEMRCFFEVQDLEVASPATVSRLGVVYMTPESLGWMPYVQSWLTRTYQNQNRNQDTKAPNISPALQDHLFRCFEFLLPNTLKFVEEKSLRAVITSKLNLVASCCALFEACFTKENGIDFQMKEEKLRIELERVCIFSVVWSLGGGLFDGQREEFSEFFEQLLEKTEGIEAEFPGRELVFSYALSTPTSMNASDGFVEWQQEVPNFTFNRKMPFFEILVPTVDTVTYSYLVDRLLGIGKQTFVTGVTGTGKSSLLERLLTNLSGSDADSSPREENEDENGEDTIPPPPPTKVTTSGSSDKDDKIPILALKQIFSANTKSIIVQDQIETKLDKKTRDTLWGPRGCPIVLFIDDVNMPKVEEYGAQPPIELLRQLVDFGGFYNRQSQTWTNIEGITTLLSAAPPGGGRSPLTPRFMRHFNVLSMPEASSETMKSIFGGILDGFLDIFPTEIRGMGNSAVNATIDVYENIREQMRPTPSRAHYMFNLRDVAKVIQGILQASPETVNTPQTFVRLWIHEAMRVFHDRLVSSEDRLWFTKLAAEKSSRDFYQRSTYEEIFEPEEYVGQRPPILFGAFYKPGERIYSEFTAPTETLQKMLVEFLDDYNTVQKNTMDLVFFSDAIDHLSRVARILSQPRGSALLVGVGGSGRQSLTNLACEILEYKRFSIFVTKGYGSNEFREDLKTIMYDAGVNGTPVAFCFSEIHIVHPSFLEDINSLLSDGSIPNIWLPEDKLRIVENMRKVLKGMRVTETRANCLKYFQQRLRDNLHMVISLSPASEAFRAKLRDYPALLNCVTIDWYSDWPSDALRAVATRLLSNTKLLKDAPSETPEALVDACVLVHSTVGEAAVEFLSTMRRHVYITPKTFLDSISLYLELLKSRGGEVEGNRARLQMGIEKLESTNEMVEKMQVQLTDMQPKLAEKAIETQALLEQVAKETKGAEAIASKVMIDEEAVKKQQEETAIIQADAQKDLDRALPALEKAIKALNALEKKDITEMRSYATPPEAVQKVMEAVCLLLGVKPDWDQAKKLMQDSQFMSRLVDYDKDNIKPKIIRAVGKYTDMPVMTVENVSKVSVAAKSLCMWVHSMVIYDEVAKDVEPKRVRLAEMNDILASANATLAIKQAELKAVMDKVDALKKKCDDTVAEKEAVTQEIERTKQRLMRAEKLTVGLADELVRWKETVQLAGDKAKRLIGDVFLASAAISYYGAFTGNFRKKLFSQWKEYIDTRNIPSSTTCTLISALSEPVRVREWQINGLPSDRVSTGNAIMVEHGLRWPLLIDPQEQAKRWIKKSESKNQLMTCPMNDVNLLRNLETATRTGRPLLLEDIGENINLMLDPILLKQWFKQSGRVLIHLGDSDVDFDERFRFYMTTKLHNPHYTPEVCIKVTVINFTVTVSGLEDQLLEHVVRKERPDVERRKNALVVSMAGDRRQLADIEKKILRLLSESKGNILDDEELVNTLASSKTTSTIIKERVIESEQTEIEINDLRNGYRPAAVRGALIYFVISEFVVVDPMYQYSLEYFIKLFIFCIDNSKQSKELQSRLEHLQVFTTAHMYKQVCRGLFQRHTLTFSFLICCSILKESGKISSLEFSTMIRGAVGEEVEDEEPFPENCTLLPLQWTTLMSLEKKFPKVFKGFTKDVQGSESNWNQWHLWSSDPQCNSVEMPGDWSTRLTPFQQALVIKTFREDLAIPAMANFISLELGESFTVSPPVSMTDVYADTDAKTPCIFVLSPGADPTSILLQFAESKNYAKKLKIISLGQGQGARAENLLTKSVTDGSWVLLQNCHLAKSWMPSLERIVFELSEGITETDRNFRLFLTSFPASYFPVSVLQTSIKMTNEPPRGLRANMLRSFDLAMPKDKFQGPAKNSLDRARRRILLSLSFFHAIVQERRKFGPLGWNIRYEFNDSDIVTSISVLEMFLEGLPTQNVEAHIPWDALLYVTGEINYGGRVTDDWDRRCLRAILKRCYEATSLDDGTFALSNSGVYHIPSKCTYENVISTLQNLPVVDQPEVFGLHANAGVAALESSTAAMFDTILSMQPKTSVSSPEDGEEVEEVISEDDIVKHLASHIEEQVPESLDKSHAHPTTFRIMPESGLMDSLGVVLSQELVKFNKVIDKMNVSLSMLQKAIEGLELMSDELDGMYVDFRNNKVPANWTTVGYASLKPLSSWVLDTIERVEFMRNWLKEGCPNAFPLYLFFFPQGFLTGALQNYARKHMIPINTLDFGFIVLEGDGDDDRTNDHEDITEPPEDGVIIYGIHVQGMSWNGQKNCLADSKKGEMFSCLPPIHFLPARNRKIQEGTYVTPVYKTTARAGSLSTTGTSTNFVVAVELPSEQTSLHWVLNGGAGILNLDV